MANFALISYSGLIMNVICLDADATESFKASICAANSAHQAVMVPDGQLAIIGGMYENNKFYPPKPYPSWEWGTLLVLRLNIETGQEEESVVEAWVAPTDRPSSGDWAWNESNQEWVEII